MEEIRWEAVQTIFWRALDLSMEERRSAVRAMCKKDIELFDEVMELLEEDARNHSLLDSNVRDAARGMLELGLLPSLIQRQIGPYRLLSLLGEGGMGVVYLAERTDIGGKVAIKLLRDAWLSPMRRERFRVEQQTLAQLNHPSIAYAAPEQLTGGAVGMYTDVYALGMLLFELLTTRLPIRKPGNPAIDADESRERPSVVIRRDNPEYLKKLGKNEWTDLDSLTLKALALEVDQRYSTVDAMIRDIDAFQSGRPLEARPPEWQYTLNKFIRRNRRLLATAAASLFFVTATGVLYTVRIARARDVAIREAARTLRIQKFTENLFDGGDSSAAPAAGLRVIDLLDRGRHEAESLGGDPLMQADMRETLGEIYHKLGKLDLAEPLLFSALDERRKALGSNDSKVGESIVAVAMLRKDQGRLEEAVQLARSGLDILRRSDAPPETIARAMVDLGSVLEVRGKYDEASEMLQSAVKLQPKGEHATANTADNLTELANVLFYKGQYDQSELLNRQALDIYQRLYGEEHPAIADVANNLGAIQSNRGNYAVAEAYYRRALKISEAWYGPEHPETAANLTALAQQLSYQNRDDEAQTALERALEIQKHVDGGITSTVATTQNQLGLIAVNRKQFDVARSYFTNAMEIWKKNRGDQHEFVAVAYSNLGSVCMGQNDFKCAEANYREAVRRLDAQSKDSLNAVIAHLKLGRCLLREVRFQDAEVETLYAYQYLVKHVAANNGFLAASRKDLAAIYDGLNRKEDAAHIRSELASLSIRRP